MTFKRNRFFYCLASTVVLIALVYFGHPFVLAALGSYFVVEDPLEPASAIVVLSGEVPFRALEAARLYREKLAPKVVLTRSVRREEYYALAALGLPPKEQHSYNRDILLRSGVPSEDVVVLSRETDNTLDELKAITQELVSSPSATLIIVTSKVHTRRVAKIWDYLTRASSKAIVRGARDDPFEVQRWWKDRRFALGVARESLGLVNYWLGFPMG